MVFSSERGRVCIGLSLALLMGMAGCTKNPRSAEHTEVTGQVLFQGKPLPGGQVTFVSLKGGFASTGIIDENGNYQVKAPVGEVEISVTNRMLQSRGAANAPPHPSKAGEDAGKALKGRWVFIPKSYEDPHTSGLKYTVTPGSQTHTIELSSKPRS
jgi:hypothetical protein